MPALCSFRKDQSKILEAYELYKTGVPCIKIGELYDVSNTTVLKAFKTFGLKTGRRKTTSLKGRKWSEWKPEGIEAILYGMRHNRYTPEYAKKLSESKLGEKCYIAKLTDEKVIKIRQLWSTGNYSCATLGEMFSVSRQAVTDVVKERTWKHLL